MNRLKLGMEAQVKSVDQMVGRFAPTSHSEDI